MNANLSLQDIVSKILLCFLFLVFAGCNLEVQTEEGNDSVELPPVEVPSPLPTVVVRESPSPVDLNGLDKLMEQNLKEFGVEFSKLVPQPDKVDYERVKFLFEQSLIEKEKGPPEYRFQFLCDEKEKLIYRCNKVTGEIECYSNRSDKLKILSSIK